MQTSSAPTEQELGEAARNIVDRVRLSTVAVDWAQSFETRGQREAALNEVRAVVTYAREIVAAAESVGLDRR